MMRATALILVCASACGGMDDDRVLVRACNASTYDFDNLEWEFFSGPLVAGECTAHGIAPETVYSYTYVKIAVGGDTFESVPIDYVGERPLAPGYWSHVIELDVIARSIRIHAEQDPPPEH